jgi:hypothetical protein
LELGVRALSAFRQNPTEPRSLWDQFEAELVPARHCFQPWIAPPSNHILKSKTAITLVNVQEVGVRHPENPWYGSFMTEKRKGSSINASSRVLGDKTFAAISAVEGLKLGKASRERLEALGKKNLTPAQKRAEVLRAYVQPKGR